MFNKIQLKSLNASFMQISYYKYVKLKYLKGEESNIELITWFKYVSVFFYINPIPAEGGGSNY